MSGEGSEIRVIKEGFFELNNNSHSYENKDGEENDKNNFGKIRRDGQLSKSNMNYLLIGI